MGDKITLKPLLKWPGGKERELSKIKPKIPDFDRYIEPFLGGGAVYFSVHSTVSFANDLSSELMNFYEQVKKQDAVFFRSVENMAHSWSLLHDIAKEKSQDFVTMYREFSNALTSKNYLLGENDLTDKHFGNKNYLKDWVNDFVQQHTSFFNRMIEPIFDGNSANAINVANTTNAINVERFLQEIRVNLVRKLARMKVIESKKGFLPDSDIIDNIEASLKSAFYMYFRYLYNHSDTYAFSLAHKAAIFFFIRNYAYSAMFRYNMRGEFNVPYGGIGYNNKDLAKKLKYFQSTEVKEYLQATAFYNEDFETFLRRVAPKKGDFVFCDPPYDTEFSTYAQNDFGKQEHARLAQYLITECQAKWMLLIKNTAFIYELYNKKGVYISSFDKSYQVSFMNRNSKDVQHLIIRNYQD